MRKGLSDGAQFIVVVCLALGAARIVLSQECQFPSEIQTIVRGQSWKRAWYGGIRDQFTTFSFQLDVNGSVIRLIPTDPSKGPESVTRRCISLVLSDRYLVTEENSAGSRRGFSCLKFIMRSAEVMQILSTGLNSELNETLCNDEYLRPDKWLTIDKERLGVHRVPCPLVGGFTTSVFDKLRNRGVCDAWHGETRLESECSPGDGITFLFRSQSCVPEDMYMYATQTTHCLATWTEEQYTFTLIRHDIYQYSWLLRFPTAIEESFMIYLFKDLFAETAHLVRETFNYLRLDTTRIGRRPPGDLCYDDYERCTLMKAPCIGGILPPQAALTCPLKCGLCTQSSPIRCRLRPDWIGKWDSEGGTHNRSNSVTINGTTLTMHSHHHIQNLECIKWQGSGNEEDSNKSTMFVTEYSNGCRPRYICARFQMVSPSLLNLTLSKTVTWPFIHSSDEPLDCNAAGFKPKPGLADSSNRSLVLHARSSQHPVNCHLPFRTASVQVYFSNRTTCSGRLGESRSNRKAIELSLRGCSTAGIISSYVFLCVESSRFPPDDDLFIIARTQPNLELYCLVFPFADDTTFHLISGAELCQNAILRRAGLDNLHLLRGTLSGLTFRSTAQEIYSTTTPEVINADRHTAGRQTEADVAVVELSSPGDSSSPSKSDSEGTETPIDEIVEGAHTVASLPTPTTPESLSTEHPIVMGFVALIFGILQGVIYFCSCF